MSFEKWILVSCLGILAFWGILYVLVRLALRKLEKEEIKKEECKHESMHVLKKYVVCLDCGETEEIKNEWRHLWEKKDV